MLKIDVVDFIKIRENKISQTKPVILIERIEQSQLNTYTVVISYS